MPPSYLLCALYIFLSTFIFKESLALILPPCGQYEEYRQCGPKCPISCKTLYSEVCCNIECTVGCFCKDGYMLVSDYGPKKCVAINDCPKPGILEFRDLTITVLESAKVVVITILRLNGSYGDISVRWRTVPGTAKEQQDFIPATGILSFPDGITARTIEVKIVDDFIYEPDEFFTVELFDPTNKAEIYARRQEGARVIIKDDDARPGHIQFSNSSIIVPENFGTLIVIVLRLGGSDGILRIRYRTVDGTARAQLDYVPVTGVLTFNHGDIRKAIQVTIINDDIREPLESFKLQLFDPSAGPDAVNFRQLSSLVLTADITIVDDDMSPGYIEFELIRITVLENIGVVNVTLVRLGGTDGLIRTRYRTVDGTARAGSDYVPANGEVVFRDGEPRKVIPIRIIDDNIREPTETFQLQIVDVIPGPDVINFRSLGSQLAATIIITDNDMNPGYIEFELIRITVLENIGVLNVTLVRLGGTDGLIRTRYRTVDGTARAGSDYVPANGEVVFRDGEPRKVIPIRIIDDNIREPTETFQLQIVDVTPGPDVINFRSLGSQLATTIVITDNDMKIGYVEFTNPIITVPESIGVVKINVVRIGGKDGEIRIRYRTVDGSATAPSDYRFQTGELVFREGETLKWVTISIVDDNVREPTENFRLELLEESSGSDVMNFRSLGRLSSVTISIIDDDAKLGLAEFERRNITVLEDVGFVEVVLLRIGGTDGILKVNYRTLDGTATDPSDYIADVQEVVFQEGVDRYIIRIKIVDDLIKEPTETFSIEIFESDGVLRRNLGQRTFILITILDNDNTPGIFEFKNVQLTVPENIGTVRLPILRKQGSDGTVTIQVRTRSRTATEGVDYLPPPRALTFPEGVLERTVDIQIIDDNIVESTEELLIGIFSPTNGGIIGDASMATIVILDDDDPSIIRFGRRSGSVREDAGFIDIPVIRENRLNRRVSVSWRTEDLTAIAGEDYRGIRRAVLTFEPGEDRKTIRIEIIDNTRYEDSENFDVVLFDPSRGAALGVPSKYTVEIIDNDIKGSTQPPYYPANLPDVSQGFQISFRQQNIRVREDAGEVRIPIRRTGGLGPFTVQITTEDISARGGRDYRRTRGPVAFQQGDIEVTIAISIINDDVPEPDKTFLVRLFDATMGTISGSMNVVTVTIVDDDGSDGGIGARKGGPVVTSAPTRPPTQKPGPLIECPDHLILKVCADTCPPSCDSLFGKVPCSADGCIKGCFCPDGLVKESGTSDKCIRPSQCPGGGGGGGCPTKRCSNGGLSPNPPQSPLAGLLGI